MADMDTLRNIVNDTPTDATDVEWNFNTIETFLDTSLVNIDGTNAMTAPLTLQAGDPTNATDAANKQYVDKTIGPGFMQDYAGDSLTAEYDAAQGGQWLICDGAIITDATYPELASVLAGKFDTSTPPAGQTYLPDFRRRTAVGYDALTPPFDTFGAQGGVAASELITHTHIQDTHNHIQNSHGHGDTISANQAQHRHSFADSSSTTSGSGAHGHGLTDGASYTRVNAGGNAGVLVGQGTRVIADVLHTVNDHTHTVAVSGNTGYVDPAITVSGGVTNATATNQTKVAVNQDAGTATADADAGNYFPHVTCNKIIHV